MAGRGQAAPGQYHVAALTRGTWILRALAERRGTANLTDLTDATGVPKSTLVRLLSVLEAEGFITRVDDRPSYRLGHEIKVLADAYIVSLDLSVLAHDVLGELAAATQQTINLGILAGGEVLHVCVELPQRAIRYSATTGSRASAHSTGLGKVLLSQLDDADAKSRLPAEPYPKATDKTVTTWEEMRAELRGIRRRGYAIDDQEHELGLRCLAVPIVIDGGHNAALSASGPAAELAASDRQRLLGALHKARDALLDSSDLVVALAEVASTYEQEPA